MTGLPCYEQEQLTDRVQDTLLLLRARYVLRAINPRDTGAGITLPQAMHLIALAKEVYDGTVNTRLHERIAAHLDFENLVFCAIGRLDGLADRRKR